MKVYVVLHLTFYAPGAWCYMVTGWDFFPTRHTVTMSVTRRERF